jgi:hypothetical protein
MNTISHSTDFTVNTQRTSFTYAPVLNVENISNKQEMISIKRSNATEVYDITSLYNLDRVNIKKIKHFIFHLSHNETKRAMSVPDLIEKINYYYKKCSDKVASATGLTVENSAMSTRAGRLACKGMALIRTAYGDNFIANSNIIDRNTPLKSVSEKHLKLSILRDNSNGTTTANESILNQTGNCGEMNSVAYSLYKELGLNPVIKEFYDTESELFNHRVCELTIDNQTYIADAWSDLLCKKEDFLPLLAQRVEEWRDSGKVVLKKYPDETYDPTHKDEPIGQFVNDSHLVSEENIKNLRDDLHTEAVKLDTAEVTRFLMSQFMDK